MKSWRPSTVAALALACLIFSTVPARAGPRLSVVEHTTRVKILESNGVSTRPGSVYDIRTRFESIFSWRRPAFNYLFLDTGLGAAEPLYPLEQVGHQGSWGQLLPAFFSKRFRHIDHYTQVETPEGCRVDSAYMLRHIREFPNDFQAEREEGYENIVIRLEYYTRLTPDAQCGRHRSFLPDPDFDAQAIFKTLQSVKHLEEIPFSIREKFDARVAAIRHLDREFGFWKWARFRPDPSLKGNSLWFYPDGSFPAPTTEIAGFVQPISPQLVDEFTLEKQISQSDFATLLRFLDGKPDADFDATREPGGDMLDLSRIDGNFAYSIGTQQFPIRDVRFDVGNPEHFIPIAAILRPFEPTMNHGTNHGTEAGPELRFVYQLKSPLHPAEVVEQLYLHLTYEVPDGVQLTPEDVRKGAKRLAVVLRGGPRELSFSSSLTGTWIFGQMHRDKTGILQPQRIVRQGIDLGYYSSLYDNDLFRERLSASRDREEKRRLTEHLRDLTVADYRDPKRHDAARIQFHRMSCAQCHQFSGRDGVHVSRNDGLDRTFTAPVRVSEYLYREIARQLNTERQQVRQEDQ